MSNRKTAGRFTRAAHRLLPLIEEGVPYIRAGVIITDLRPAATKDTLLTFDLDLGEDTQRAPEKDTGQLLHEIGQKFGRPRSASATPASKAGRDGH